MTLKNKSAVVTGSTSGIGQGIAEALAAQGCNILFNGFGDQSAIDKLVADTAKTFGVKTAYSNADMTKPAEIRDMVAKAATAFGSVDILVNNAGIQFTGAIETYPEDKWDTIIAINLSALFHSTKAVIPHMKKGKFGRIVNIASVHGLVASAEKSAYVAAKHGVVGLTKVTALELANENITCNAICPGWVLTPLVEKQIADRMAKEGTDRDTTVKKMLGEKQPKTQFITTTQLGQLAVFLCSDAASVLTGASYVMDGGWTAQ